VYFFCVSCHCIFPIFKNSFAGNLYTGLKPTDNEFRLGNKCKRGGKHSNRRGHLDIGDISIRKKGRLNLNRGDFCLEIDPLQFHETREAKTLLFLEADQEGD